MWLRFSAKAQKSLKGIRMNKPRHLRMKGIQVLSFLATLLIIPEIKAQKAEPELIKALDEFVVVGSRHQERSSADSPVPVDVIDQDDFLNQGYTQMDSLLAVVIPSFNVNAQPVSGSPSLIRPAYLRGLPGDSTLILVNGKRRHAGHAPRRCPGFRLGHGTASVRRSGDQRKPEGIRNMRPRIRLDLDEGCIALTTPLLKTNHPRHASRVAGLPSLLGRVERREGA